MHEHILENIFEIFWTENEELNGKSYFLVVHQIKFDLNFKNNHFSKPNYIQFKNGTCPMFHLYYLAKPRVVKSVAVKTILVVNIVTHSCVTDYSVDNPINSHSGNIPTLNVSLP